MLFDPISLVCADSRAAELQRLQRYWLQANHASPGAALVERRSELENLVGGSAIENLELDFAEARTIASQSPLAEGTQAVAGQVSLVKRNSIAELSIECGHKLIRRHATQVGLIVAEIV